MVGPTVTFSQETQGWDRYLDRPRGPYRGQVVDAATKAPLPGAVVVVRWLRDRVYPFHTVAENYAVRETVTDSEGRFLLDVRDVEEGLLVEPAVRDFSSSFLDMGRIRQHVSPTGFREVSSSNRERSSNCHASQTERSAGSIWLFRSSQLFGQAIPGLPALMRRINEERVRVGLEPYSPE